MQSISVEQLREAELTNEEIIELTAYLCSGETAEPFSEQLLLLDEKYDMTLEMRPLAVEVFSLREQFKPRALRNLFVARKDQGYDSLIVPLIVGYQSDPSAAVYARTLSQIFGVEPQEELLRELLLFIRESEMDGPGVLALERHFTAELEKVAEYAPVPSYVKEFSIDKTTLPMLVAKPITKELPNDLIADYFLTQIDSVANYEAESAESMKQAIVERLEKMSQAKRDEFIGYFQVDPEEITAIRKNEELFRIYGPVNPFPDTDFSDLKNDDGSSDLGVVYGGARMFLDTSLEWDYEGDEPVMDWFLGYCLQCSKRIRHFYHALRIPNVTGGWRGCYCSFDCVKEFLELDSASDPDTYDVYTIRINLMRVVMEDLERIGIAIQRDEAPVQEEGVNQDRVDQLARGLEMFAPPPPRV